MDSSWGRDLGRGLLLATGIIAVLAFGLGVLTVRGYDYVRSHYSVRVERKAP